MAVRIQRGSWQSLSEPYRIKPQDIPWDATPSGAAFQNRLKEELEKEKEQWRRETQRLLSIESKRAYQKGYEEGRRELQQVVEPLCAQLNLLMTAISQKFGSVWDEVEHRVPQLALTIARRIIGEAAEEHQEMAKHLAWELISKVKEQSHLTIWVNPADLEALKAVGGELQARSERGVPLEIMPKASLKPGSVEIETELGTVLADPEHYLKAVQGALPGTERNEG